ncbi:MAG: hypothetical protein PWP31_510 [Clostridia bacterium]|nr:hypothetical protein [Clostridia bacterium]
MIYSPIPPEVIWEGALNYSPKLEKIKINNIEVEVEPLNLNQARIVRIFSTDPYDYLDNAYQPGSIINLGPQSISNP